MRCVSGGGLKAHANGRAGSRRRTKRKCRNHLYALPPTAHDSLGYVMRKGMRFRCLAACKILLLLQSS